MKCYKIVKSIPVANVIFAAGFFLVQRDQRGKYNVADESLKDMLSELHKAGPSQVELRENKNEKQQRISKRDSRTFVF